MLAINFEKHKQTTQELLDLAIHADHPRTRERFHAIYEIATGKNTIQVGKAIGRNYQTVMEWVHKYNNYGAESLFYQRSGGRRPLFAKKSSQV